MYQNKIIFPAGAVLINILGARLGAGGAGLGLGAGAWGLGAGGLGLVLPNLHSHENKN